MNTGADELPSRVAEQRMADVTPPPTLERMELPPALVAPLVVGTTPQVEAPVSQAQVTATMTSQAQLDTAMVVTKEAARSVPPVA